MARYSQTKNPDVRFHLAHVQQHMDAGVSAHQDSDYETAERHFAMATLHMGKARAANRDMMRWASQADAFAMEVR